MSERPVYLDHHSTTPCDPRVVDAMLPYFTEKFGNPAAITHLHGREAATALEEARSVVADFLRVRTNEVYFTAGATESNNIALRLGEKPGAHVITTAIEHKSVLAPLERAAKCGTALTVLEPDREGFITPAQVEAALRPETVLVSVMLANGEIGTIEPLSAIASVCRARNVIVHTDATQAVGKLAVDVGEIGCDLLSLSAHKIYGPKGIGALIVKRGVRIDPLVVGGGQEKNVRSGTVNVPGAVGLAAAIRLRAAEMQDEAPRLTRLRNRLWDRLILEVPGASVNGPRESRLPGNLNVTFDSLDAEALILALRRFSLSSGSACSSGDRSPSAVLRAIGLSDSAALASLRIGLGRSNTVEEVDLLVEDVKNSVLRLREISVR